MMALDTLVNQYGTQEQQPSTLSDIGSSGPFNLTNKYENSYDSRYFTDMGYNQAGADLLSKLRYNYNDPDVMGGPKFKTYDDAYNYTLKNIGGWNGGAGGAIQPGSKMDPWYQTVASLLYAGVPEYKIQKGISDRVTLQSPFPSIYLRTQGDDDMRGEGVTINTTLKNPTNLWNQENPQYFTPPAEIAGTWQARDWLRERGMLDRPAENYGSDPIMTIRDTGGQTEWMSNIRPTLQGMYNTARPFARMIGNGFLNAYTGGMGSTVKKVINELTKNDSGRGWEDQIIDMKTKYSTTEDPNRQEGDYRARSKLNYQLSNLPKMSRVRTNMMNYIQTMIKSGKYNQIPSTFWTQYESLFGNRPSV